MTNFIFCCSSGPRDHGDRLCCGKKTLNCSSNYHLLLWGYSRCNTGYSCQVCLLSRFSLLLTCGSCLEIKYSSFIPFSTMGQRLKAGARCLVLKPPGFPSMLRLPSNIDTCPGPAPRGLPVIQGISRQCHNTSPFWGAVHAQIWENHGSPVLLTRTWVQDGLLETTPTPLKGEATKPKRNAKKKGK